MKEYAKFYQLKNQAKDALGGKYGTAIWVAFLGTLIPGAYPYVCQPAVLPLDALRCGCINPRGADSGIPFFRRCIPAFIYSVRGF